MVKRHTLHFLVSDVQMLYRCIIDPFLFHICSVSRTTPIRTMYVFELKRLIELSQSINNSSDTTDIKIF